MIAGLTDPEVREFIQQNENEDIASLVLRGSPFPSVPMASIADQIMSRRKARIKLPTFYSTEGVIWPPPVSIEQSSSEITAAYKAGLFKGNLAADLCGGTGVDSYFLAGSFGKVDYVEKESHLTEIANHNFGTLGRENIRVHHSTVGDFLSGTTDQYDVIYIDPDRRPQSRRVVSFEDSEPNVIELIPEMLKKTDKLVIKASPMMDIGLGISELQKVTAVHIVAVKNECREVLFELSSNNRKDPIFKAVNISGSSTTEFLFTEADEKEMKPDYSDPLSYLYEPNTAILKAGGFQVVGRRYNVFKLHPNSHLYTSQHLVDDFPGRIFRILDNMHFSKKLMKTLVGKGNVTARNFPMTAEEFRKSSGLKDGGDDYYFLTTGHLGQRLVIKTEKAGS